MANTKYPTSLTGEQIDQALSDMASRNSEAYAIGTRNGADVSPSDPTYHNNSKYWAEQAQGAIPPGYDATGVVRGDIAQTAQTEAWRKQARANIQAGGTNPNLLDNPWFTVNQRGVTNFTTVGYTIDRWRLYILNGTCSLTSGGISSSAGSSFNEFRYVSEELPSQISGNTVTLSLRLNGVVHSRTVIVPDISAISSQADLFDFYIGVSPNQVRVNGFYVPNQGIVAIRFLLYGVCTLRAVKLELGSVSTLANDAPPNYAEELAKCQRYFNRIAPQLVLGAAQSGTTAFSNSYSFPEMRTNPTLSTIPDSSGHIGVVQGLEFIDSIQTGTGFDISAKSISLNTNKTTWHGKQVTFYDFFLSADL